MRGLERLVADGRDPTNVVSVASFFVSRVDTEADPRLEEVGREDLQGRLAVDNAKLAYQHYLEVFSGERWDVLAAAGARPQRCLWASTSTKNPAYRDVLYVEELIGADTVNTMPFETIEAFQDHGVVRDTLTEGVDEARALLQELAAAGVDYDDVTATLERRASRSSPTRLRRSSKASTRSAPHWSDGQSVTDICKLHILGACTVGDGNALGTAPGNDRGDSFVLRPRRAVRGAGALRPAREPADARGTSSSSGCQSCRSERVDVGNLYRTLRSLEEEGLVSSEWSADLPGPTKRTYTLTDEGHAVLASWLRAVEQLRDGLTEFLEIASKGGDHVRKAPQKQAGTPGAEP